MLGECTDHEFASDNVPKQSRGARVRVHACRSGLQGDEGGAAAYRLACTRAPCSGEPCEVWPIRVGAERRTSWLATGSVPGVRQQWHGHRGVCGKSLLRTKSGQRVNLSLESKPLPGVQRVRLATWQTFHRDARAFGCQHACSEETSLSPRPSRAPVHPQDPLKGTVPS